MTREVNEYDGCCGDNVDGAWSQSGYVRSRLDLECEVESSGSSLRAAGSAGRPD